VEDKAANGSRSVENILKVGTVSKEDMAATPSPDKCWTTYYSKLGHPDGAKCELPFSHMGGHEGRDSSGHIRKWLVVRSK